MVLPHLIRNVLFVASRQWVVDVSPLCSGRGALARGGPSLNSDGRRFRATRIDTVRAGA